MRRWVLTTRHHDGLALWPTGHPNAWSTGTAPFPAGTDFVRRYVNAVRGAGLRVALSCSPIDWRHPGCYDVTGAKPPDPALSSDATRRCMARYSAMVEKAMPPDAAMGIWFNGRPKRGCPRSGSSCGTSRRPPVSPPAAGSGPP